MAKFCVECGDQLNDSVRFCGSCGTAVLSLCPTCGQKWEQVPAKALVEKPALRAEAVAEKQPPAPKAAIPVATSQRSFPETSARVKPIYGVSFDPAKDCPNCGAKGMGRKTCTTCEREN